MTDTVNGSANLAEAVSEIRWDMDQLAEQVGGLIERVDALERGFSKARRLLYCLNQLPKESDDASSPPYSR